MNERKVQEALDLLQEECAEIIQIISKIRRFGFDSVNPYSPEKNNKQLLIDEIGDFETILEYLLDNEIIKWSKIYDRIHYKMDKLKKYTTLFENDKHEQSVSS